jgi:hypothetical protein
MNAATRRKPHFAEYTIALIFCCLASVLPNASGAGGTSPHRLKAYCTRLPFDD